MCPKQFVDPVSMTFENQTQLQISISVRGLLVGVAKLILDPAYLVPKQLLSCVTHCDTQIRWLGVIEVMQPTD